MNNDVLVLDDTYIVTPNEITIREIIGAHNDVYMNLILLSSSILLSYVIWMNFFYNSKYQTWLNLNNIDIHELQILPVIVLVITTLSYKGVI